MQEYKVVGVNYKESRKILTLQRGTDKAKYEIHRFAPVGIDDDVLLSTKNSEHLFVKGILGAIKIKPHFEVRDYLILSDLEFEVKITELITQEDFDNYNFLEKYHYRTNISSLNDELETNKTSSSGGRRSVLLLYVKLVNRWEPAGYIELQMPLLMCKPRHELFRYPYFNESKNIKWESWNLDSMKQHVNQIVRIGRIVTSPELRGLGLAKLLITAAKKFSIERWQIQGKQPFFMEISAEMLKYIDFVSSAGFKLIGHTEGNVERVYKDLKYMNKGGYNISSGIMSLQNKYLTKFKLLADQLDLSFEQALIKLEKICVANDPNEILDELSISEYYLFKNVLRLPIPYYLMPLDEYTSNYLFQALIKKEEKRNPLVVTNKVENNLKIRHLNIHASYNLTKSKYVKAIMNGFGIETDKLIQPIVENLSFTASRGNIIFVSGASGTGKSLILKILNRDFDENISVKFSENNIDKFNSCYIENISSTLPLIEYFGQRYGIEKSISALNRAGLSEAFIYLKPYSLLSRGQQYRARFAELIIKDADIWIMDEFGSDLDVITSKIVANNLRKLIIKYSKIAIIAAANHEHFIDILRPTRVILLKSGRTPEILSYKDYRNELFTRKNKI